MVENAMCSDPLQNIQPNKNDIQSGENVKIIKQIKDIQPIPINKPLPMEKPKHESNFFVKVGTIVYTNEGPQNSDELQWLRIGSDSPETLKYIMELLGVKKVDQATSSEPQTTSEPRKDAETQTTSELGKNSETQTTSELGKNSETQTTSKLGKNSEPQTNTSIEDRWTSSFRPLFEKALKPIADSHFWYDGKIEEAVNIFCEIPTNEVIKTYPIDQILYLFRCHLRENLKTTNGYAVDEYFRDKYFRDHEDLPQFRLRSKEINSDLDRELRRLASDCGFLLYLGSYSRAFGPVLSIIFGIDK